MSESPDPALSEHMLTEVETARAMIETPDRPVMVVAVASYRNGTGLSHRSVTNKVKIGDAKVFLEGLRNEIERIEKMVKEAERGQSN